MTQGSLRSVVSRAKRSAARIRLRLESPERSWERGRLNELTWWERGIKKGGHNSAVFAEQLDPNSPLGAEVADFLPSGKLVRILDAGAGPMTRLGKTSPGRTLEIVAVDALADDYERMLTEAKVTPLVPTLRCRTEDLSSMFAADSFDLAYARNTIDHHHDAVGALRAMATVVRPGGRLILWHRENEAERAGYHGMHQHNFQIEGGSPVLWNRRQRVALDELFEPTATRIHAGMVDRDGKEFVHLVYERNADR